MSNKKVIKDVGSLLVIGGFTGGIFASALTLVLTVGGTLMGVCALGIVYERVTGEKLDSPE